MGSVKPQPFLSLMIFSTLEVRQQEMADIEADAMQLAHVFTIQEQDLFDTTRQLLIAIGHLPALNAGDMQVCQGFLTSLQPHYHRYANLGWGLQTALRGAAERLPSILMTALVTGLGLMPLALGTGEPGREIEGPMATIIVGGLATSTLLNLLGRNIRLNRI